MTADFPQKAVSDTAENCRLLSPGDTWRQWGPYLSERQWGTVREDYSAGGDAWDYFPHDHARSRAYRWGEDGIGGFGDDKLGLCLAVALWNGKDPFLKERLFGLNNAEGNHGEDVKEQYYYLDGLPTHSYMKMLYKYPKQAFPYEQLVAVNKQRGLNDREYELLDTGIFDDRQYFDVQIEYAKASPDDILLQITVFNRSSESSTIEVIPQLWARNTWSWAVDQPRTHLAAHGKSMIFADHPDLLQLSLHCDGEPELLFCENETNARRLYNTDATGFFKDGVNDYIVNGCKAAVNPDLHGTKAAARYKLNVTGLGQKTVRLRLSPRQHSADFGDFDTIMASRRSEADEFYEALQKDIEDEDSRRVQRQALAGMLWSKQFYAYDIRDWLVGDPLQPVPPDERKSGRNADWQHMTASDILSMPDKWEYPWFASWDLGFHCVTLALIDPDFAKSQLILLTQSRYMHPNGQIPAYEWDFNTANPPVHAWAAFQVYQMDQRRTGVGDKIFLKRVFHKLMINFTWWVNRKDSGGKNIFQGGFLGLDNIGLFDLTQPLPTGGHLDQSDGTAWVAAYALNLMRIALELAADDASYEDLATKFFEHFLYIAEAVHAMGGTTGTGLWDDDDGFYYDVLQIDGQRGISLRVRSMIGLIPLFAIEVLHDQVIEELPKFRERLTWFLNHRPDLAKLVSHYTAENKDEYSLLALMRRDRLKRVLSRMLDESEFLSDFGIRAVSKSYAETPYIFDRDNSEFMVQYSPAESRTRLFGGNSNWRGPIWMPVNYLIIEALYKYHIFYNDDYMIEYPTGSGKLLNLAEIAAELSTRLKRLFLRNERGRRTVFGDSTIQQDDPEFRDHLLFYEYFDGDTGRGLGASHQTGWTALIALLLHPRDQTDPAQKTAT